MKDKPVAWMSIYEGVYGPSFEYLFSRTKKEGFIPLYTHPVKELTGGYEVMDMSEYDVTVRMPISDWEELLRKAWD